MDITEVPMLTAARIAAKKEKRRKALGRLTVVICCILTLISVIAHAGAVAGIGSFVIGDEMKLILLDGVLPARYTVGALSEEEHTETTYLPTYSDTTAPDLPSEEPSEEEQLPSFYLRNETSYNPDLEVLFNSPDPIDKADRLYERYTEDAPLVLIYHTHATESYSDTNDTGSYRSEDRQRNMVSVGRVIAEALEANGIGTIHLEEMFDLESYNDAYYNSAKAVDKITEQYPSLQYIIDVHRDSIVDGTGEHVGATFEYGGESAAQLMFVVGTDEGGSEHTEWRSNLSAVLHLEENLLRLSPDCLRPINLRRASFYQHRSPGAMLLEVGSCGNTLKEAKRSAALFSHALTRYVLGKAPALSLEQLLDEIE